MDASAKEAPAAVCGGCGEKARKGEVHRRGRCVPCYERWVRAKPVGLGATCAACGERRHDALRQFELPRTWLVLCGSCAARAEALVPPSQTVAGLKLRLHRERRWGDRRADAIGGPKRMRFGDERRDGERRVSERNWFDATEFAELVLELDAEFADEAEGYDPADGPVTGVHRMADFEGVS
jgi:hypothetical protein